MTDSIYVLEAPPCERCSKPVNDLTMSLLVWNRNVRGLEEPRFDGLHFFHKRCDPGPLVFATLHEVGRVVQSPQELIIIEAELLADAAAKATRREHWVSVFTGLAWLQLIASQLSAMAIVAGEPPRLPTAAEIASAAEKVHWPSAA